MSGHAIDGKADRPRPPAARSENLLGRARSGTLVVGHKGHCGAGQPPAAATEARNESTDRPFEEDGMH